MQDYFNAEGEDRLANAKKLTMQKKMYVETL
jgi:hypothetical protein